METLRVISCHEPQTWQHSALSHWNRWLVTNVSVVMLVFVGHAVEKLLMEGAWSRQYLKFCFKAKIMTNEPAAAFLSAWYWKGFALCFRGVAGFLLLFYLHWKDFKKKWMEKVKTKNPYTIKQKCSCPGLRCLEEAFVYNIPGVKVLKTLFSSGGSSLFHHSLLSVNTNIYWNETEASPICGHCVVRLGIINQQSGWWS